MRKKGKAVRLTDQAHQLLAEMAEDYGVSQKEMASEAIVVLVERDQRQRTLLADVARLEEKNQDNKLFALGTFLLGAVIGGALTFVILVGIIL